MKTISKKSTIEKIKTLKKRQWYVVKGPWTLKWGNTELHDIEEISIDYGEEGSDYSAYISTQYNPSDLFDAYKNSNHTIDMLKYTVPRKNSSPVSFAIVDEKKPRDVVLESRVENGLRIFKLQDQTDLKNLDKVLKAIDKFYMRVRNRPDVIYMNQRTLGDISIESRHWELQPGESSSIHDMTLFGLKVKISQYLDDGKFFLIRDEF